LSGGIDYRRAMGLMRASGFLGSVSIENYFGDVWELHERSHRLLQKLAAIERNGGLSSPEAQRNEA
jgi:hypothetical protein